MKNTSTGKFVISLDFELMWGVRDVLTVNNYGENIKGVHKVIPRLLDIFKEYNINATFSTVGFLFYKSRAEILQNLPALIPRYTNKNVSPYEGYFNSIGNNAAGDPYHYAPQLIALIQQHKNHEIGTHTFSHYYCLEEGQTINDFREDILSAKKAAEKWGITITSLVFPRNQFNNDYLEVCKSLGIICVRGNEKAWMYKVKDGNTGLSLRRAFKLADTYINISGYNCYRDAEISAGFPVNIPASRFLRPYAKKLAVLDSLRLKRITAAMTYAARHNQTFHLWWHPHNFGIYRDENFLFLTAVLKHYKALNERYKFTSYTMSGLANHLLAANKQNL